MKQKTKKLLQLSFSLGFLATTALVATSCNQPKTVAPKPTNPMQPGNGSGSETTTPGTGETMQPGNNSGSGTGTATPDNTEAKNQLNALIDGEDTKLAMYDDYSVIKSTLATAYATAKTVDDKTDATKDELANAITTLQAAITKAAADKKEFDDKNIDLVTAYKTLKNTLSDKETKLNSLTEPKYQGIKTYLTELYKVAETITANSLQANDLTKEKIEKTNTDITTFVNDIGKKREDVDQLSVFKKIVISSDGFKGDFVTKTEQNSNYSIVGIGSDLNEPISKYAKRVIKNLGETPNPTDVSWIYSLVSETGDGKKPASYGIEFEYYGGEKPTLYFPYKLVKSNDRNNLSLKYKLNDSEAKDINLDEPKVDEIKVAKIPLENLKLGDNKISFTTDSGKVSPMIGNMYISSLDTNENQIYNDIFGTEYDEQNPDKITVNFAKGYGLANKQWTSGKNATIITKLHGKLDNQEPEKDFYLVGYLGNRYDGNSNDASNIKFYTFYVNVQKAGNYEISGIYNSGVNRGLSFYVGMYGASESGLHAKFTNLNSGDNNWDSKVAEFKKGSNNNNQQTSLKLLSGLNKIIVAGDQNAKDAPNLGDVTFTYMQSTTPSTDAATRTDTANSTS
ncbi:Vmc-like lipoprotein signal peptide domain-containing protein [Mycoplasma bradburyae]|uniref:Vmc-like lipoprotein signal peptide domain-containing protein n=1 Tax=Mycoplasma bradburyae TaxID=2963128 RepID=UPI0020CFDCBC|nr:hypothetical protein [Mycoplasma bradburyae]UTS70531.1 hypothetical protein NMG77_02140 [Mycoplasma bradburyae]